MIWLRWPFVFATFRWGFAFTRGGRDWIVELHVQPSQWNDLKPR